MRSLLRALLTAIVAAAIAVAATVWVLRQRQTVLPDPPSLLTQVREVARLETMEVTLYKKVTFAPGPEQTDAWWKDVYQWAEFTLRKPQGKALVFATAHVGLDLEQLGPGSFRVTGQEVEVQLPELSVTIELRPEDTEFIQSNLTSAETSALFEKAKRAFEFEVRHDEALMTKARLSGERHIRTLLLSLGFKRVRFTTKVPTHSLSR